MDREFERARERWLERHMRESSPERLKRLEGKLYLETEFLEKLWWPAFGTLEHLYPEYEVRDYQDGRRFIDHAYKPHGTRLALEADGFNPHVRDVGRWEHADGLIRDAHLIGDGWTVLHFSSDVIRFRSRQVQQLLKQIVWRMEGGMPLGELTIEEREVLRFAMWKDGAFAAKELQAYLCKSKSVVYKILGRLLKRNLIRATDDTKRRYRLFELTRAGREVRL